MNLFLNIVMIGSGNLATNLAVILCQKGHFIQQVYSKQKDNAKVLADRFDKTKYTDQLKDIETDADLYIFSIKDNVLEHVVENIPQNKGIWVHTAGSMPIDIFNGYTTNYGVFYPLQTFSKNKQLSWDNIPIMIEANNIDTLKILSFIAHSISESVHQVSSENRKYVHLSAVFACNFSNCMYVLSQEFIAKSGLPFDTLLPLINETANKLNFLSPLEAQTGPAVRMDSFVIDKHLAMINTPLYKSVYEQISEIIYETQEKRITN